GILYRRQRICGGICHYLFSDPDVLDHRFLSPLFFTQNIQNPPNGAIRIRRARCQLRSAGAALVGCPPSPSPPALRPPRRSPLAPSGWVLVVTRGLVHV